MHLHITYQSTPEDAWDEYPVENAEEAVAALKDLSDVSGLSAEFSCELDSGEVHTFSRRASGTQDCQHLIDEAQAWIEEHQGTE